MKRGDGNRQRKNTGYVSLGSVIPGLLRSARQNSDEQLLDIWDLWGGLVGEAIAANARPGAFKGTLLLVEVSSSVWIQQLQFLKPELIRKINEALGKPMVEDIKFRIG